MRPMACTYTLYILYSMALVEIAVHLSGDDAWQIEKAVMVYIICTLLGSI